MQHLHDGASKKRFWIVGSLITLVIGGAFAYTLMRVAALNKQITSLSDNLASTTAMLYGTSNSVANLNTQTEGISQALSNTKEDVANSINAVKDQVGGVQQTVGSISNTVSTLQKLSVTDQELLRKYSKVYFLNENYTPAHLSEVPQEIVYSNTKKEVFLSEALPSLLRMVIAAKSNGVTLYIFSAYRSFATQQTLKSAYTVTYGAGTASAFSADQGYSEHQLGTTADFMTPGMGGQLTKSFESTPAFNWLKQNAYKYGFELSYPKGNAYYIYEPWHWRFVGVKLATYLHDNNKNFYDMDQRDIDAYLADLFE